MGASNVPAHWYRPFGNKVHTYINARQWFTTSDMLRRFGDVARAVWAAPI